MASDINRYRVVKPHDEIHAQKQDQIGSLISCTDNLIGLLFDDGTEFWFYPDELEKIKN